jgi:hypothetical protein
MLLSRDELATIERLRKEGRKDLDQLAKLLVIRDERLSPDELARVLTNGNSLLFHLVTDEPSDKQALAANIATQLDTVDTLFGSLAKRTKYEDLPLDYVNRHASALL